MAPDAPAPRYNAHGDRVGSWTVYIHYDDVRDHITVLTTKEGTRFHARKRWTKTYSPEEVAKVRETVDGLLSRLTIRRLF